MLQIIRSFQNCSKMLRSLTTRLPDSNACKETCIAPFDFRLKCFECRKLTVTVTDRHSGISSNEALHAQVSEEIANER